MRIVLTNAFSINMLTDNATLSFTELSLSEANYILGMDQVENTIGHADTDAVVRSLLWTPVPKGSRKTVEFPSDGLMIVAQYTGPRLQEGATALPEGLQ